MSPPVTTSRNDAPHGNKEKGFLYLMGKKRWEELALYLTTAQGREEAISLSTRRFGQFELNLLHALCWWGAPLIVIELVPNESVLASESDRYDRTPLHVSIEHSADVDVITHILRVNPEASLAKDYKGRTPLISVCQNLDWDATLAPSRFEEYHGLIKSLIDASPMSVLEEDEEDMEAIEHAICSGAPRKIVRTLQRAVGRARKYSLMAQKNETVRLGSLHMEESQDEIWERQSTIREQRCGGSKQ